MTQPRKATHSRSGRSSDIGLATTVAPRTSFLNPYLYNVNRKEMDNMEIKRHGPMGVSSSGKRMLSTCLVAALVAAVGLLGRAGPASAQPANEVHFTVIIVGDGAGTVLASGAVHGVGTETDNQNSANPVEPFQATLSFAQGAVTETVSNQPPSVQFNPVTCVLRLIQHGSFQVTGGGGAFAAASGGGTSTTHVTVISRRAADGTCDQQAPPLLALVIVHETGTLAV